MDPWPPPPTLPAFAAVPARRKAPISAFAKRLVNAIAASRMRAAEAELRRHEFLVRETALTQGEYRAIGLEQGRPPALQHLTREDAMTILTTVREILAETLRLRRELMKRYPHAASEN